MDMNNNIFTTSIYISENSMKGLGKPEVFPLIASIRMYIMSTAEKLTQRKLLIYMHVVHGTLYLI